LTISDRVFSSANAAAFLFGVPALDSDESVEPPGLGCPVLSGLTVFFLSHRSGGWIVGITKYSLFCALDGGSKTASK
jgi:hypothetical protein